MNEEQIERLVRAAWDEQPPDDLEHIIEQAARQEEAGRQRKTAVRAQATRTSHSVEVVSHWLNRTLVGADGATVGRIIEIYLDDRTEQPNWALVASVAERGNLVPIADAVERDMHIRVPFESHIVASAPGMPPAGALSKEEEADLHRHYGLEYIPRPMEFEPKASTTG